MGCWGITALESDNGLDAVRCVRYNLPADGQLDLGEMLERLKKDRWNAPCDVKLGCAHTSPMALAEIVVKYLDGDPGSLDYDEEWAAEDNKFRSITSFTASRASLRELRRYHHHWGGDPEGACSRGQQQQCLCRRQLCRPGQDEFRRCPRPRYLCLYRRYGRQRLLRQLHQLCQSLRQFGWSAHFQ